MTILKMIFALLHFTEVQVLSQSVFKVKATA